MDIPPLCFIIHFHNKYNIALIYVFFFFNACLMDDTDIDTSILFNPPRVLYWLSNFPTRLSFLSIMLTTSVKLSNNSLHTFPLNNIFYFFSRIFNRSIIQHTVKNRL